MNKINITLELFGAARSLYPDPKIKIELPLGSSLSNLREFVQEEFKKLNSNHTHMMTILNSCVFATEKEILPLSTEFFQNANLALLPPVCGG